LLRSGFEDLGAQEWKPPLGRAPSWATTELTVWEGAMPESNGRSNFTAVLMRKGASVLDGIAGGVTIARSDYPGRVRYEADCVRYLIGELEAEPFILDYDSDTHSDYVAPPRAESPINANSEFKAILTAYGAELWNEYREDSIATRNRQEAVAGQELRETLWTFMNAFGPALHIGNPLVPFEDNAITVVERR
jgi:hypothetical protein